MSRLLNSLRRTVDLGRVFSDDRRGNIAIIFAFSLIPLVGLLGLGIDYGVALTDKSKLDNAADAAAVAAVAAAKAYVAANQSDSNLTQNALAAGLNQASRSFVVNVGNLPFASVPVPAPSPTAPPASNTCATATACIYLTKTNQTFAATVYYNTASQNHFGTLFKQPTMTIAGTAAASADIPSYLDFYLLIDVSGSMGIPSTSAGQTTLANNNGGCQFACHFPGQDSGYNYAIANNIQLRSGAVNTAVCGLLNLAKTPSVPQQYRVGLYPFITQMATLASLTYADTNAAALSLAAGCNSSGTPVFTKLLDTNFTQLTTNNNDPSTGTGSGGTHFETALATMQSTISSYNDGSTSAKSRPFVFIITDGMQNSQLFGTAQYGKYNYPGNPSVYPYYNAAWWTGTQPATMDPSLCTALKQSLPTAATISVLYIPYQILTVGTQNVWETITANNAIPNIPTALSSCATPGYFYTANTPADINNALANMFNQAIQVAHLKQ